MNYNTHIHSATTLKRQNELKQTQIRIYPEIYIYNMYLRFIYVYIYTCMQYVAKMLTQKA